MAFTAALESDLRALSSEARRRYPTVKDAAEHAILKLRSSSAPNEIAHNEDMLRIFLMACDVKSTKLSVIGLSCLQKLISHDAVYPSSLDEILTTLKNHAEITDESIQLKTLQTILIVFQSRLLPENEENCAKALGICLRLLENNKSSDSVRNTAAATFRQAVALIFDTVVRAESLPTRRTGSGNFVRTSFIADDASCNFKLPMSSESDPIHGDTAHSRESLSHVGKLGLRLLEDLTALAAGGPAVWLRVHSLKRIFSLEILEFVLSNYMIIFHNLDSYEQVLRHQICSFLMTSLRINSELEGEAGEPSFRRLVLRSVSHVIRLYSSALVTECEVFLNMLLKVTFLDLPLWHQILVLEILRGFCVEARTLRALFQNFDMDPKNTNIVENIVKAFARVVSNVQIPDSSEESLAAVAGMFNSKAKGIEWSMDNDTSNAAVVVASEAHAITLAVEGLLGVVFTVATLTDEALDLGELESPRYETDTLQKCTGKTAVLCLSLVDSTWLTILDALSLILTKSHGEAIILEILKGYQAFTQACGILHAVEPLNSFLASLCKFTISMPNDMEKKSVALSTGSKKLELFVDQKEGIVLTPKNVQALRTLFNIAHRLHNVLGPSWVLVLETLAALDRAIHSPHASTQEVSTAVPRLTRELSGQNSDFNILSSLNSQLFESSALMHISAVKSLLSALLQLSNQCNYMNATGQQASSISFSVERMTLVLQNNLHRAVHIWDLIVDHLLELADNQNPQLRNIALEALDKSICSVLGSNQSVEFARDKLKNLHMDKESETRSFETALLSPLRVLYTSSQNLDVRAGSLKVLLHVLERYVEKLYHSWPAILELLRTVADALEKDLIPLGFQSVRIVMNDGLLTMPVQCLDLCVDVVGAFSGQKSDVNISLTAIGLLWTTTDFIAKGLAQQLGKEKDSEVTSALWTTAEERIYSEFIEDEVLHLANNRTTDQVNLQNTIDYDKLVLSVFSILKELAADERPEVRNAAIRTLFQILGGHGQKLSKIMWENCLWDYVFPILDCVSHLAATSSRDEWQGKELGTRGGKAVHMLIHHSRNTAQKQWDETLVLVLGGITRILKSFFPFLLTLSKFSVGWDSILHFVKDSILNGSKEVALAAVNCLQLVINSQYPKGNLSLPHLRSILGVYALALRNYPTYKNAGIKVKQEILHGLGDLYLQSQSMFQEDMYLQLITILHMEIHQSMIVESVEFDFESVSPVQRKILEILPFLHPAEHLSTMWSPLLQELLHYLPVYEPQLYDRAEGVKEAGNSERNSENTKVETEVFLQESSTKYSNTNLKENRKIVKSSPKVAASDFLQKAVVFFENPSTVAPNSVTIPSYLFGEKLVPILVNIYLEAPAREKCILSAEVVKCLGRCMVTRRDFPNSMLWRVAIDGFNCVLIDDITKFNKDCDMDQNIKKSARIRLWKEVADVYEIFLVNSCGRALSSEASTDSLKDDESLEITLLDVLGDKILKAELDAPTDSLQRLVSTLDRCASRTGCLPIETVGLMPAHCSRFSLCCLRKIFGLCSYSLQDDWHTTRLEISKISILILMSRCECILNQFLTDEHDSGEHLLPHARHEETVFILQELARLVLHRETSSVLKLQQHLKDAMSKDQNVGCRVHLLMLLPSFSELVVSRDVRIRELVQVLLRLIAYELGLQKTTNDA